MINSSLTSKRSLLGLLCGSALLMSGVLTFAQTPDDEKEAELTKAVTALEVTQAVPLRAPEPQDEQNANSKDRETLRKRRDELERELERINRQLGEPTVRVRSRTGDRNLLNDDQRREIEISSRAAVEAQRKALEELGKAQKEMSKADRERVRAGLDASRKALDKLKERGILKNKDGVYLFGDGDRVRVFRDGDLKTFTMPELPEIPKVELFGDGKVLTLPKGEFPSKDFETSMRRFQQRMDTWAKEFETRMERRMRDWEREKKP